MITQLSSGAVICARTVETIGGGSMVMPATAGRTHLQFRSPAIRASAGMLGHRNDPEWEGIGSGDGSTHLGLPADFLIDPDGTIVALRYGQHADDQWSVDKLLDIHRGT